MRPGSWLPRPSSRISRERSRTAGSGSRPRYAAMSRPGRAPAVEAAVETSLFAPAKRLRPILALLVAEVLKGDPDAVLPAGLRHRDGPHREPDPRRPAVDGRREDAPRAADLPRGPRRGDRGPRRLRAHEPRVRDPGRGLGRAVRTRRGGPRSRGSSAGRSGPTG